jgi:MFS family permease
MSAFVVLWLSQLVSIVGSGLTLFALPIWLFKQTGSPTVFGLTLVVAALAALAAAPLAGSVVDRYDRRRVMIAANLAAGAVASGVAWLAWCDRLSVVALVLAVAADSVCDVFQQAAFSASVPLIVPQERLSRANGMVQAARAVAQATAPALAGVLMVLIGFHAVVLVDAATFFVAVGLLLLVSVPRPAAGEGDAAQEGLFPAAREGWRFVRRSPGLLALLGVVNAVTLMLGGLHVVVQPMILGFSTPEGLGIQVGIAGTGLFVGGLVLSLWSGPRRKVPLLLGCLALAGVCLLFHVVPSIPLLCVAGWVFFFSLSVVYATSDTIWQTVVPAGMQGRCFAVQRAIGQAVVLVGYAAAGPLAARVFEPLLAPGGSLVASLGGIVGVGPGRGIALMFAGAGIGMLVAAAGGAFFPRLRRLEQEAAVAPQAAPPQVEDKVPAVAGVPEGA